MSLLSQSQVTAQAETLAQQYLAQQGIDIDYDDDAAMADYARMVQYYITDVQYRKIRYFQPYEYQRPLYHLHTMAQAVIASNRSGKSYSVGYAIACHLTGIYPEWWTDVKYPTGIKLVCAGASSAQMREAIQETLFGTSDKNDLSAMGSGLLPRDTIVNNSITTGADKRAVGGAQIHHTSGTTSSLIMVSYEQDRAVLQGGKADVIWLDEQPRDDDIVSELIRALAQTPTGQEGRLYLSATPLVGWTEMIKRFWNGAANHGMVRYSWDDVPLELLDQKTRDLLISSWLPWEIDARTRGIPMAGEGAVFQVFWNDVILDRAPEILPEYRRLAAIDFGRSPDPTAVIWMAWDQATDIMYVYDEYYGKNQTPVEYAPYILQRGREIPLAWPADGQRRGYTETTSAVSELGQRYGINILAEPFTNPDGSRGIDYGLQFMIQRMRMGKLKISPHCCTLIDEMKQYHTTRTAAGRVGFRGHDHGIDACRYATLSLQRYAQSMIEISNQGMTEREIRDAQHWVTNYDLNTY